MKNIMELKNLKKSLFGFNKNNVMEYISELNRTCSEKVEEERQSKLSALNNLNKINEELNNNLISAESENDALKKDIAEKDAKIAELNEEINQLKNNADTKKLLEAEVADILTEARHFAVNLREKAIKENEAFCLENQRNNEAEKQRISDYGKDISKIKAEINAVLANAKSGLETAEKKLSELERKSK